MNINEKLGREVGGGGGLINGDIMEACTLLFDTGSINRRRDDSCKWRSGTCSISSLLPLLVVIDSYSRGRG